MSALDGYECTCENEHVEFFHMLECGLYECDAFDQGLALWDTATLQLRWMTDEERAHYAVYNVGEETELEWLDRPGDKETFTTNNFVNPVMAARMEAVINRWVADQTSIPANFTAFGCSWVWDSEQKVWESQNLGCWCTMGTEFLCTWCGVERSNKGEDWRQVEYDDREYVCKCKKHPAWSCYTCQVTRQDRWQPWAPNHSHPGRIESQRRPYGKGVTTYEYVPKCRHFGEKVQLLDGLEIWASSQHKRTDEEPIPDWAFYLDRSWTPQCLAIAVPWIDMGLPELPQNLMFQVFNMALELMRQGKNVEVGCIGGHGRTGTFIASLLVLQGMEPDAAIAKVRAEYCKEAIESKKQEWYVTYVHSALHDLPVPEMPTVTYGQDRKDKGKNKQCTTTKAKSQGVSYCTACLTDCKSPGDTTCWWCEAEFTVFSKEDSA